MITASQLSRIAACPASASLPKADSTSVYAARGSAIHRFLAEVRAHGRDAALARVDAEWQPVCEAIDLDALPVTLMAESTFALDVETGKARWLGSDLDRDYRAASATEWVGTADVIGIDGEKLYIGDYFTGWTAPDKDWQLKFLALAAARTYGCDEATVEVIRIRENGSTYRTSKTLDALDLDAIAAELRALKRDVEAAARVIAAGGTPDVAEGDHCRFCKSWSSCPAKTQLLRLVAGGQDVTAPFMTGLSRATVGSAYVLAEQLRGLARELDKRVAAAVEELGECETPRGTIIRKALVEGNECLDGEAVWSAVARQYGPSVADRAVKRTATKVGLKAALKSAGVKVAQAEREVLDEVRQAGGASRSMSERLVEVDPAKERVA